MKAINRTVLVLFLFLFANAQNPIGVFGESNKFNNFKLNITNLNLKIIL